MRRASPVEIDALGRVVLEPGSRQPRLKAVERGYQPRLRAQRPEWAVDAPTFSAEANPPDAPTEADSAP